MLQNAYLLAEIGADTAEIEQHFAEILPIGRRVARLLDRPAPGVPERRALSGGAGGDARLRVPGDGEALLSF